ncbi:MAG: hypothetical protein B7Z37_21020 [Verrucomicrobia bacterium 12-59-8]|nr:MAG: hypothetical protein B7Z37_21020 [Verrucomicrobia bacterium 12-59-8]
MAQYDAFADNFEKLHQEVSNIGQMVRKLSHLVTDQHEGEFDIVLGRVSRSDASAGWSDTDLSVFAKKLYLARRDREKDPIVVGLFHDPAWDILLDLFIAYAQDKLISVTGAGLAGQVPESTALRWVWVLEKAGFIKREPDSTDRRRNFVLMSPVGLNYMRTVLSSIAHRMNSPLLAA